MYYSASLVSFCLLNPNDTKPSMNIQTNVKLDSRDFLKAYNFIGCEMIQVVEVTLEEKKYQILCDEEGRYKDSLGMLLTTDSGSVVTLSGSLLFSRLDENSEVMKIGEQKGSISFDELAGLLSRRCKSAIIEKDVSSFKVI